MLFMERQQKGEEYAIATAIRSSLQSVVRRRSSNCTKEGAELVSLIWSVCLGEVVRCVSRACIEEKKKENLTALLNIFTKHCVEVQTGLLKARLRYQDRAPSFRSTHLYVSRRGLVVGRYTSRLKGYVGAETLFVIYRWGGTSFSMYSLVTSLNRVEEW